MDEVKKEIMYGIIINIYIYCIYVTHSVYKLSDVRKICMYIYIIDIDCSFKLQFSLQFAVCGLQFAVCSLQLAVCSLQFAVSSLKLAVCSCSLLFCSFALLCSQEANQLIIILIVNKITSDPPPEGEGEKEANCWD